MSGYYRNLVKGQYQLGDIVMGHGTNIIVENFDVKPYDINTQDYQVSRSDEVRFGYDAIKPTTIEMQMVVIYNWLLDPFKGTRTNFWHNMPTAGQLANAWRANDIRTRWGDMEPLYFCGRDGIGKVIFGRPGQFGVEKTAANSTLVKCVGEFRRADTYAYSAYENFVQLSSNAVPQYLWRGQGDTDTWMRIVGYGPLTNPKITIGEYSITLNATIPAGQSFEISSYPWQRRAIGSDGTNLRNFLVNDSAYLDRIKIPYQQLTPVRWTASNLGTFVPSLGNANFSIDMTDSKWWKLPAGFNNINGEPVVRTDIFNPTGVSKFIGSRAMAKTEATIYTAQTYNTTKQYVQARVVEPYWGRSALVMMSNANMTNFVALEVSSGVTNYLHIKTGSAYNNLSTAKASYVLPSAWKETDIVGLGYNPSNNTFTAYLNGTAVLNWVNSGVTVNATTNKYIGFIFDIDGNMMSVAPGFKDIVAYDNEVTPADSGSVYLFWRDAWSTIE